MAWNAAEISTERERLQQQFTRRDPSPSLLIEGGQTAIIVDRKACRK
jgi:hypothetical protein